MAEIGYGYGSEWHLMRFMARHRNLLEKAIRESIGNVKKEDVFEWYDFLFGEKGIASDSELKGLSFLENRKNLDGYVSGWKTKQSWDAVFKLDDVIYLVEAKAHIDELSDNKPHGGESTEEIKDFICKNLEKLNISINKDECLGKYYQLANRLATAAFLKNNGIDARCMYIYFLNGYDNPKDYKSASAEMFKDEIYKERETLGLKGNQLDNLLYHIFIDAKTGEFFNLKHQ